MTTSFDRVASTMPRHLALALGMAFAFACASRPVTVAPTMPASAASRPPTLPPTPPARCATVVHHPFASEAERAAKLAGFRAENPGDWSLDQQDATFGNVARGHRTDYPRTSHEGEPTDATLRAFLAKNRRYLGFTEADVTTATIAMGPDGAWRATNHLVVPGTEGYTEPPFTRIMNVSFKLARGFVVEWLSLSTSAPERLDLCAYPPYPPDRHAILGRELSTYTNPYAPEPDAHFEGRVEEGDFDRPPSPHLHQRLGPTGWTYTVGWRVPVRGGRFVFFVDTSGALL